MLHPLWTRVRRAMLVSTALVFAALVVTGSPAFAQAQEWVITGEGLGPLRLGEPIDDVIASLPEGYAIGAEAPIADDFDGRVVSLDGEVHAIVRVDAAGNIDRVVVTGNYATADGIGPGARIAEAEIVYGDAQLSWSADDLGRERVVFADNPAGVSFRASEDGGPEAGIYGQGSVSVLYQPDAVLSTVWIVDPADDAFGPAPRPVVSDDPADTSGSDEPSPSDVQAPHELPRTGAETATVVSAAFALVFTGLGITRVADRLCPWS